LVVAFYLGIDKLVPGIVAPGTGATPSPQVRFVFSLAIFFLALVGTPLYLARQAEPGQDWHSHVLISTLAFPIWAYAAQGSVFTDATYTNLYSANIAGIAVPVFTFRSGLFPFKWPTKR
jgi:hypothetical protein